MILLKMRLLGLRVILWVFQFLLWLCIYGYHGMSWKSWKDRCTLIWWCSFVVPINKSTWAPFLFSYAVLSHNLALFQWNSVRSAGWWKVRHFAHSTLYYITNGITLTISSVGRLCDFFFILDLAIFYSFSLKSDSLTFQKKFVLFASLKSL